MKNLENYGVQCLDENEMLLIEGGFIGDLIEWLDKNWVELKTAAKAAYDKAMGNCNCNIAKDPNINQLQ